MRLIPYSRMRAPPLRSLAGSPQALEEIARIEQLTDPPVPSGTLNPLAPTAKAAPGTPVRNASCIHAAFARRRPTGNRFNGPDIGAWNAGFRADTALAEVTGHITRAWRTIGRYDQEKEYVGILADFGDDFPDCRGVTPRPTCIGPDPKVGYPAGQELARALRSAGMPGPI
ncbi:MAG: RES family NAD+ phosphorylase [Parvibaculum sp.]